MNLFLLSTAIGLVGLFALVQLVPYRVTNRSTHDQPAWDQPQRHRSAAAACFAP